ncbi:MAG: AAA family ATPase [Nitrospinae bacterium]|nr:AAA family ATPase [Nitrospinota bacterium]
MEITSLKLTNVRSIETAEFRFQPGFNLIAGVNGVGKSTVLDALRFCLSRILTLTTKSRAKSLSFEKRDIRSGFPFLDAELSLTISGSKLRFTRRQWREEFAADDEENLKKLRREILESERLRDRALNLLRELEASHGVYDSDSFVPSKARFLVADRMAEVAPNGVFFSTNRSVVSSASTAKSRAAGGKSAAYAEALVPRRMYVAQFADWMRVQEALAKEQNTAKQHLQVLRSAVKRFLPTYENLRPANEADEKSSHLMIGQGKIELDVGQLSDGERGVLALVLDLARRLSQANPSLDDPLSEGHAVVLIDELDLHLHPKWQRQIVHNLTRTFPRCQFIATTHSPQVVASVEPDQVLLLAPNEIIHPDRSLGMDSNWILRHLMEADDRPEAAMVAIQSVENLIEEGAFEEAHTAISKAKENGLDLPEWSVLEARIARLEILAK